ncbi:hypothetical protein FBD73_13065 [Lacticaseibacillus paracasei]|nr:hypothetical protein FBD73_13065 [Lacticaseibacillus paracasei]
MGLSRANSISSSWPEIAEFGTASPFLVQIVFPIYSIFDRSQGLDEIMAQLVLLSLIKKIALSFTMVY